MNVVVNHAAQIALATLTDEDRRRVHAWFDHLKNWDHDETVRSNSKRLSVAGEDNVYVLRTTTDLRIFFVLRKESIEVIDIAPGLIGDCAPRLLISRADEAPGGNTVRRNEVHARVG